MDKCAQMKRFNYDRQLQVYIYFFNYADPETMSEEEYFRIHKNNANYNIMSNTVPVPKHWLGFSYIRLEEYLLDLNFDVTEMKSKSDHSYNN